MYLNALVFGTNVCYFGPDFTERSLNLGQGSGSGKGGHGEGGGQEGTHECVLPPPKVHSQYLFSAARFAGNL